MIDYLNINDIDIKNIVLQNDTQVRRKGYSMNKDARSRTYHDSICAFDIETTTIDEIQQSIMYIWQFQYNDITIIGRTWDEFRGMLEDMTKVLDDKVYMVIFVHNLSFEFQYLSSVFADCLSNVFCVDSRKVLKCDILDHFEFRCSYLHSNMGLETYTKKMGVKDFKLKGDIFDYNKKRFPWDNFEDFTDYEKRYILNDVKGLVQAIQIEMDTFDDNLYSFPLTSTGYVRRDAKTVMKGHDNYIRSIIPSLELLQLERQGFRGGNTHANRYHAGHVIYTDVGHQIDISSSYPTQIFMQKYPISQFKPVKNTDFDRIWDFVKEGKSAYMMTVMIRGLELQDITWGCPYIPKAKCVYLDDSVCDNGRVLSASICVISITDIDLKIILQEYDFDDLEVLEAYKSNYGMLPYKYRNLVLGYYQKKTLLKGDEDQKIYYDKMKAQLNALYGLMCQNPLKPEIEYDNGLWSEKDKSVNDLYEEYSKHAFLSYSWACWVTAYARKQLEDGIRYIIDNGGEFLYTDTDSIKYLGDIDISGLNDPIREKAEEIGAYADDKNGVRHYMGLWEAEDDFKAFATLGAKKYAYVTEDGKLHITVAGVNKSKGAEEMAEAGGIEKFKTGFIYNKAGGTEVIYNDIDYGFYEIDGHTVYITKNILIKDSTYTLGITNDYQRILEECKEFSDIFY